MNEPAAPAADIMGGVGVPEAVRIQRQAREGLLPGPWLNETARKAAAREKIKFWLGRVFRRQLFRDALRSMHGRHGWGWRYLNKYMPTGEPTLALNHYENALDLVLRSQDHGATHGTGKHLVYL